MPDQIQPSVDLEAVVAALNESGSYRVLRKIKAPHAYCDLGEQEIRKGLIIDIETTGLSRDEDRIIELSLLPFEYGSITGEVGRVHQPVSFLEDPERSLPQYIIELTGITDDMLQGKRIDDGVVQALFDDSAIVIAHNAAFDRPFVDHRFDFTKGKPWACSWSEIPWDGHGFKCAKLECLLPSKCAAFVDAHRAENDCIALIHVLATPFDDGTLPMATLLESARQSTHRVWATGAPYEVKNVLKGHGYSWNNGDNGEPKAWWIDVRELGAELEWLKEHGYGGRDNLWKTAKFSAKTRYCG